MKTNPTAQDVARQAKVSQSAVSRTFTPGASVSPAMRTRVMAAAEALGYRPNAIARSLITRRSRIIGVVVGYLENQFYPLVLQRLSQSLKSSGYHVLLFVGDGSDDVLMEILQYQVDGIVLASATLSSHLARDCAETGVPVVFFNRVSTFAASARVKPSSVTSDNVAGGRLAAELLVDRGYKRIAYVSGLEDSSTNADREQGFLEALGERGRTLYARAVGHYDFQAAQAAARALFSGRRRPDAVFVANDHMAMAVMDVLRLELGLRIPEDVAVVGFDDVPQASWGAYRLTTLTQSVEAMVAATVKLLLDQIEGTVRSRKVVVPCVLVERATVGRKRR